MYKLQSPEDQHKFIVPLNRDTETLYYDKRMIVDANVETEPRTWKISKIERTSPFGIANITLYQDRFNSHTDYIERDEDGLIIGMWADYWIDNTSDPESDEPKEETEPMIINGTITITGGKKQIKVGGSYRKLTMSFTDADGNPRGPIFGYNWTFKIDGKDVPDGVLDVKYRKDDSSLEENQIMIKFIGSEDYYGSVLTVLGEECSIDLDIVGI